MNYLSQEIKVYWLCENYAVMSTLKQPASAQIGSVFNIQRFSIHDGPGIRTTVFFLGCSLRCFWCHNPEGLHIKPEIAFFSSRCIGCGECVTVCPEHAQELLPDGTRLFHRDLCTTCGECVDSCFAGGLVLNGKHMTAAEVLDEVRQDRAFYETSGGGITLSGGEPLLQPAFAFTILEGAKQEGLHTAIETTIHVKWELIERLLPVTDLFMVDIKHMDSEKHRVATGVPNPLILENARRLANTGKPVLFRVPVVTGVNDSPAEIAAIANFVRDILPHPASAQIQDQSTSPRHAQKNPDLELLPFHRMAGDKYTSLGLVYQAAALETPSKEKMALLAETARQLGLNVRCR